MGFMVNPSSGHVDAIHLVKMSDPGAGGYLVVLTVHQVVRGRDTGNGEFVMDQRILNIIDFLEYKKF